MNIPGFKIERELGRGGMARVYLAVQERLGRNVALKVVSTDISNEPTFKTRFLGESKINAQMVHPNIVQIYDAGSHEQWLYLVMEYINGGDLNARLEKGMHIQALIKVIKDIGRALDFAHEKGVVHRDIKPENILFREDGSAVLTDFGIARAITRDPSLTRAGTVVGTPQYMSPEQAAGRELDGRSDLYSLGVVFYRMLTGDVPYKADTAVAVGIKHLQDPIPRLPHYLRAFQSVIDRALAKKPEHRYQSGGELARALDEVRSSDLVPNATIKARAVTTEEIRGVGSQLLTTMRDPVRAERKTRRRRRRRTLSVVGGLLFAGALGGMGYSVYQNPELLDEALAKAGLTQSPDIDTAWQEARSLQQDPNQGLAAIVAGYRRVLSLDPDHTQALTAVENLSTQWRTDIEQAIAQKNLALAETKLQEASVVFALDESFQSLATQLANQRHAENLISSTQALLRSHGLSDVPSATAAIQAFQEALRLVPDHPAARAELDALAQHYVTLAAHAADEGEVSAAIGYLDRASAANDAHPQLEQVRNRIQQAATAQAAIDSLIQQARAYRAAGALLNPAGENAAELYHRVLSTEPGNAVAVQGLNEVVSQLRTDAFTLISSGEFEQVRALVDRATAVGLEPTLVQDINQRMEQESTRLAAVTRGMAEARQLISQGYLTEPPSRNAVSVLREVDRMDPGNEDARALLRASAERLAAVAREANEAGMRAQAIQYLELALAIAPDVTAWQSLRDEWGAP